MSKSTRAQGGWRGVVSKVARLVGRSGRATLLGNSEPRCELLESRRLLTVIDWTGLGGDFYFDNAANWVGGQVPGPGDDAVVEFIPPLSALVVRSNVSVANLRSAVDIRVEAGGVLEATEMGGSGWPTFGPTGIYMEILSGGTLKGHWSLDESTEPFDPYAAPGRLLVSGGAVLDGVHLHAGYMHVDSGARLRNDLVVSGTGFGGFPAVVSFSSSGRIIVENSMNLSCNTFLSGSAPAVIQVGATEGTSTVLTLGGRSDGGPSGWIYGTGSLHFVDGPGESTVVNRKSTYETEVYGDICNYRVEVLTDRFENRAGTSIGDGPGHAQLLVVTDSWANYSPLTVRDGGDLTLSARGRGENFSSLRTTGGYLELQGASVANMESASIVGSQFPSVPGAIWILTDRSGPAGFSNQGVIATNYSEVGISASFSTDDLNGLSVGGGQLNLAHSHINNSGRVLSPSSYDAGAGTHRPWVLGSGTIVEGGVIDVGAGDFVGSAAFHNVSIEGLLEIQNTTPDGGLAELEISGGLQGNGRIRVAGSGTLISKGVQMWDGPTIELAGDAATTAELVLLPELPGEPIELTLAPGTIIEGGNAIVRSDYGVLRNSGHIRTNGTGTELEIGVTTLENHGWLEATAGTLTISSNTLLHAGNIHAFDDGMVRILSALFDAQLDATTWADSSGLVDIATPEGIESWRNRGFFWAGPGGLVRVGGRAFPGLFGVIESTGGDIVFGGLLDLGGLTMPLPTALDGRYFLSGGRLSNGRIGMGAAGSLLTGTSLANRLTNIGLMGDLDVRAQTGLVVDGGSSIDGDMRIEEGATVFAPGTQTWSGSGRIQFVPSQDDAPGRIFVGSATGVATLTLDGLDIDAIGRGEILAHPGIGSSLNITGDARIGAIGAAGSLSILAPNLAAGTDVEFSAISGGTLSVLSASWTNNGAFFGQYGTIVLGGAFSNASIGEFNRTNTAVILTGVMNNANATLSLTAPSGEWIIRNGTINGGTIAVGANESLATDDLFSRLNGVTVDGDLHWAADYARIIVDGGLTLNGTAHLERVGAALLAGGSETLTGTGAIAFEGPMGDPRVLGFFGAAGTLTIEQGLTVRGGNAEVGTQIGVVEPLAGNVVLRGTLRSDAVGRQILVTATNFTNGGDVQAVFGGVLLFPGHVTNYDHATGTLTGGRWRAEGVALLRLTGSDIRINRADVTLIGSGAVFDNFNPLASNEGILTIGGGRALSFNPVNGVVLNAAGATFNVIGPGSYALPVGTRFTNNGTFGVLGGAVVTVPGETTNAVGGVLIGGTWNIEGGSRLTLAGNGQIFASTANIALRGVGSRFDNIRNTLSTNLGTLTLDRLGAFPFVTAGVFTNTGSLTFVHGPEATSTTLPASLMISSSGDINIDGYGALVVVGSLVMTAGSLDGSGALVIDGRFEFLGGALGGDGLTIISGTGAMTINAPGAGFRPFDRDLLNQGLLDWKTGDLAGAATLDNLGTFLLSSAAGAAMWSRSGSNTARVENRGLMLRAGVSGVTQTLAIPVDVEDGSVVVASGSLAFTEGGVWSHGATIAAGSTLTLAARGLTGDALVLESGAPISGAGNLTIGLLGEVGQATLNSALGVGGVMHVVGGTNTFNGEVTVGARLLISGGVNGFYAPVAAPTLEVEGGASVFAGAVTLAGDLQVYGGATEFASTVEVGDRTIVFGGTTIFDAPTTLFTVEFHAGTLAGDPSLGPTQRATRLTIIEELSWDGGTFRDLAVQLMPDTVFTASGGAKRIEFTHAQQEPMDFNWMDWTGGDIDLRNGASLSGATIEKSGGGNLTRSTTIPPAGGGVYAGVVTANSFRHTWTGVTQIDAQWTPDPNDSMHALWGTVRLTNMGGVMSGSTLTTGSWRVEAGAAIDLFGATVRTNNASIHLSGPGVAMGSIAGLTVNNGLLSLSNGQSINFAPLGGVFTNAAGGQVDLGSNITISPTFRIDNAGHIFVRRGTLNLTGGGTGGGTYEVLSPATMRTLNASFDNGAVLRGDGTIEFPTYYQEHGRTTFSGNVTLAGSNMQMGPIVNGSGANLGVYVAGTATITGTFNWTGGYISGGAQGNLVIGPTGTMNVLPDPNGGFNHEHVLRVNTRNENDVLLRAGTTTDDLFLNAAFTNNAQFIFDAQQNLDVHVRQAVAGGTATFLNTTTGVIRKIGAGTGTFDDAHTVDTHMVPLTNDHEILVEAGFLGYESGTNRGTLTVSPGATLGLGAMTLADGSVVQGAGRIEFPTYYQEIGRTTLAGNVTLAGSNMWLGAIVNGSGANLGMYVAGTATITGTFNWTGGYISGGAQGNLVIGLTGTMNVLPDPNGGANLEHVLLVNTRNENDVTLRSGTTLDDLFLGAVFTNNAEFVIDAQQNQDVHVRQAVAGGTATFLNTTTGVIRKIGAGTGTFDDAHTVDTYMVPLTNDHEILVEAGFLGYESGTNRGTLTVSPGATLGLGAMTLAEGSVVQGAGRIEFPTLYQEIGRTTLSGNVTLAGSNMWLGAIVNGSGANLGMYVAGTATITGTFNWTGGYISGSAQGNLVVGPTGTMNVLPDPNGGFNHEHVLLVNSRNENDVTLRSGTTLDDLFLGAVFTNNAQFVIEAQQNQDVHVRQAVAGGTATFLNTTTGVIRKIGAGTATFDDAHTLDTHMVPLTNDHEILVEAGFLGYESGTSRGTLTVSPGATLGLGAMTLAEGSVVQGAGRIEFPTLYQEIGRTTLSGNVTLAGSNMWLGAIVNGSGANLGMYVAGTATITGTFNWTGGYISGGTQGNLVIGPTGTMNVLPDPNGGANREHFLLVNTRNEHDVTLLAGTTTDNLYVGATFTNNGLFVIDVGAGLDIRVYRAANNGPGSFVNTAGTGELRKVGTGQAFLDNDDQADGWTLPFNNASLLDVQQGSLTYVAGTNTGTARVATGAWLGLRSMTLANGSRLEGAGVIEFPTIHANQGQTSLTGTVTLAGANMNLGQGTSAMGLLISGTARLEGTFTWTGGFLQGSGALQIQPSGTFNIYPGTFHTLNVAITNDGTINYTGSATLEDEVGYTGTILNRNRFVIDSPSGNGLMYFRASTSGSATLTNASTGTVEKLGGGALSLAGNGAALPTTFSNLGTVRVRGGEFFAVSTAQFSGTTITGGSWIVDPAAGAASIRRDSPFTTIGPNASVTLAGASSSFAALNSLTTVQGTFRLGAGRNFTTAGSLTNSGTIDLGTSQLSVNGNYTQAGAAFLEVGLAGRSSGQFGRLNATGTASLSGGLRWREMNGFRLPPSDSLQFISASSCTGRFSSINNVRGELVYGSDGVRISSLPLSMEVVGPE